MGIFFFIISEWTSLSDGVLWFLWIKFKVTGQLISLASVAVTTHKSYIHNPILATIDYPLLYELLWFHVLFPWVLMMELLKQINATVEFYMYLCTWSSE